MFTNISQISSGSVNYLWEFGNGSTATTTNATRSYAAFGIYQVRLSTTSDKGCRDTFVKPVRVYAQPAANFTINKDSQCFKYNLYLFNNQSSIGEGSMTWNWDYGDGTFSSALNGSRQFNASGKQNVKLTATSNFGCVHSIQKSLFVKPSPVAAIASDYSGRCAREAEFTLSDLGSISGGTYTRLWLFGDGQQGTATPQKHRYAAYGNYSVQLILSSNLGCRDTAVKTLNVYAMPVAAIGYNTAREQCLRGNLFSLTDQSSISGGTLTGRSWNFGDSSSSTAANPNHTYNYPGVKTLRLIATTANCADTAFGNVTVHPMPDARFTAAAFGTEGVHAVPMTAPASYSFDWDAGDGTDYRTVEMLHTYPKNGKWTIALRVSTDKGCSDSSRQFFSISSPRYKEIGNALSFYIYPNPNNGKFTYKLRTEDSEKKVLNLYDDRGRLVWSDESNPAKPGIIYREADLHGILSPGIYMARLISGDKAVTEKVSITGD